MFFESVAKFVYRRTREVVFVIYVSVEILRCVMVARRVKIYLFFIYRFIRFVKEQNSSERVFRICVLDFNEGRVLNPYSTCELLTDSVNALLRSPKNYRLTVPTSCLD